MLVPPQVWQNRLLPAASDYLPTVLLSTCQSVEKAQSLEKARASGVSVCFWMVGEVLLEAAVTASLLSASKKGSGLPELSWCFLCQPNPTPSPRRNYPDPTSHPWAAKFGSAHTLL